MGRFAFRKKRLSNVHFGKLTNVFTINGDAISIPPMFINSDLISLQLKGIYNLGIGTDLQIEIPLFKLDKEELNAHPTNASKGFRLYVRARDNELGHLQYSWKLRNKEIAKARAERKRRKDTRKASRK
jgi:hypothetical protein